MYMERQQLKAGEKLNLEKDYTIVKTIGTGASSIVYLAEEILGSSVVKDMKRYVVIKELYPKDLGICRKNQGDMLTKQQLLIPEESIQDFNLYKSQLQNAVQIQGAFRNLDETANTTMDMEAILEHNNTLYVVMGRVVGETYKDVIPNQLGEVLKICRSIAYAVGEYHKQGYLHLDIKPANIYNIPETEEIVKLFDFDTVHGKEDIQSGRCIVSCTLEYAAPEVIQMKDNYSEYEDIDERADIFSIGVILFEKIFGRLPDAEDMRPFKKWNFDESELTKTESPQVKAALTQILRKTLALLKRKRYENTEELIVALDKGLQLARNRIFLCDHNVSVTASKSYYISRKDKVEEIRERLENYHIAYLCGVGGIGKSETAREYCEKYRSEYEIIHFVHYGISLKDTIAALNFVNLEDKELSVEERYRVKVYQLSKKELYNSNMLLVIDNYNVSPDSEEYEENVEVLKRLKELDVHILFTSRTESVDLERKICVDSLGLNELKQMFFAINSKGKTDNRRINQVEELIETAFYHTLTVDLVAHQSVQIERYGKKTLQDYIDVLKENGLRNEISLSVYNNKDDCEKNDVIYEHVKALFDFSALTEKERYVMVNACLLPMSGMETAEFSEFIDLAHFDDNSEVSDWGEDEAITKLVNGGWIRREGENREKIVLHPIISEIVVNELEPEVTEKKCYSFLKKLNKKILDVPFYSRRETVLLGERILIIFPTNSINLILLMDFMREAVGLLPWQLINVCLEKASTMEISKEDTIDIYRSITFIYRRLDIDKLVKIYERKIINFAEEQFQNNPIKLSEIYDKYQWDAEDGILRALHLKELVYKEDVLKKIEAYYLAARNLQFINRNSQAIYYCNIALQLIEDTTNKLLPQLYKLLAECYIVEDKSKSVFYYKKYLEIEINDNTSYENIELYEDAGRYFCRCNEYKKAIVCFSRVIDEMQGVVNAEKHCYVYVELARAYVELHKKKEAKRCLSRMKEYILSADYKCAKQQIEDLIALARTYRNWHYIYNLCSVQNAIEVLEVSIEILKQKNSSDKELYSGIYFEMAKSYMEMKEYGVAITYIKKTKGLLEIVFKNAPVILSKELVHIGDLYEKMNSKMYALQEYSEALKLVEIVYPKNSGNYVRILLRLAKVYVKSENYNKAENLYHELIQIEYENGNTEKIKRYYYELGDIYSKKGDVARAERYKRLLDE